MFIENKRCYAPSSLAETVEPIPELTANCALLVMMRELQCGLLGALDAQGDPKLSKTRRAYQTFKFCDMEGILLY